MRMLKVAAVVVVVWSTMIVTRPLDPAAAATQSSMGEAEQFVSGSCSNNQIIVQTGNSNYVVPSGTWYLHGWSTFADPGDTPTLQVVIVRPTVDPNVYDVVYVGQEETLSGAAGLQSFEVEPTVEVQAGDVLGLQIPSSSANGYGCFSNNAGASSIGLGSAALAPGATQFTADPGFTTSGGFFKVNVSADLADAPSCMEGTYSSDGFGPCDPAPAGSFVEFTRSTSFEDCPSGYYQPDPGQPNCIAAAPGHHAPGPAAQSQTPCVPGWFQPGDGEASCIEAALGLYVSASASQTQTACPENTTTFNTGSTSLDDCVPIAPPEPWEACHAERPVGYWLVETDGNVYPFGSASDHGEPAGQQLDVIDIEASSTGCGYWVLQSDGTVTSHGDAHLHSSFDLDSLETDERLTSFAPTPDDDGLWGFTNKGRVLLVGNAQHRNAGTLVDLSGIDLAADIVDAIPTPTGLGYYMLGGDGGIFAFGDARFVNSIPGIGIDQLDQPAVGLVPDPDNDGYWIVAADGGVFAFNAEFRGSFPELGLGALDQPVIGMTPYGNGYLQVASDGGVFNFSNLPFSGSLGGNPPNTPVAAITPVYPLSEPPAATGQAGGRP
ncbi:MAG: hypothetical protein R2770_02105 [Acidimicrobiales bacterium]